MIAILAAALAQLAATNPNPIPGPPALTEAIAARDADFFALSFTGCDPVRLRTMLADDVEFYHDKGGFMFASADAMVTDYVKNCEARKSPHVWRSRRELVQTSLHIDPIPGYGAMEVGDHLFYERKGDGPEKLVGRAKFAMVWKLDGGVWKLSRALSYAHVPVSR